VPGLSRPQSSQQPPTPTLSRSQSVGDHHLTSSLSSGDFCIIHHVVSNARCFFTPIRVIHNLFLRLGRNTQRLIGVYSGAGRGLLNVGLNRNLCLSGLTWCR
jgi:hypothetical protein